MMRRALAGGLAFALGLSLLTSSAAATFPGRNGRIAFNSPNAMEVNNVFTVPSSGGHLTRLTHNLLDNSQPAYSPNGQWIAYVESDGSSARIFRMRTDGGDVQQVTSTNSAFDQGPAWSPNGRSIAFYRITGRRPPRLYRIRADGTHRKLLAGVHHGAWTPAWKRGKIAFACGVSTVHICTMAPNGTHRRLLTRGKGRSFDPDWSPGGRFLAYDHARSITATHSRIRIVRQDGAHTRTLRFKHATNPVFAPNGRRIALAVGRIQVDLFTTNRRGSHLHRITHSRGIDANPSWQSRR